MFVGSRRFTGVLVCCTVTMLAVVRAAAVEKPTFRIIAPEFICNPERAHGNPSGESDGATAGTYRNSSDASEPRQLTIGLQTNGGQRLHYRVTTYFTLLDGFVSQRHTVGLWRAVRLLEQRVRRDRDSIADSGQITIGSDELLPGAVYVFGVVGLAADGTESDEQNFTMTYRNREQGASFAHDGPAANSGDVSLLLLGAEVSYADVEYSVTAQLIFCQPRTDYYFRWVVTGLVNGQGFGVAVSMERSKMLRVPAGSFVPGRTYDVQVSVHASSGEVEEPLTKARMQVTILERESTVTLFPSEAIVGIDQPTQIRAYRTGGRSENARWTCQKEGEMNQCDDMIDMRDDDATVRFFKMGRYSLTASIGNGTGVTGGTILSVDSRVTPSVRLLEWSAYPAVSGAPFRLLVSVAGLVPKCRSNWTTVREEGFAFFDPSEIPGTLGGFYIRDIEENFLSELVDYGNDTIVKDTALFIPGAGGTNHSWKGLEPDARYKIRLETRCPEPIDDSQPNDGQKERPLVASQWTFVLETNGAPQGIPIEVSPDGNGTALTTVFRIVTGIAKDSDRDYPLRYSYWYVADGVHVSVGSFYEITSAETVLPYTRSATVGTYVVVCDSREACSKIDGPEVPILPGNEPTEADISFALASIGSFFDRLNLREALKTSFELLVTLRNRNSPLYAGTYRRFVDIFRPSVAHIGKVYGETAYLSDAAIQEFIMQAKPLLDLEKASNHELFEQLLELMDVPVAAAAVGQQRHKRSGTPAPALSSAGNIKAKLYLMEGMTASSNASVARQSRTALLNYVHQAAKSYCSATETHHVYVGQLITLEVDRYRSLSEVNFQHLQIPNQVLLSSPVARSQIRDSLPETEYFCLGRIYYARDLFVEREVHELDLGFYEAFLLSVEKGGMWTLANWKSDYFLWSLDGRQLPNVTCQLWEDDGWSRRNCITTETPTDQVLCNCTRIGYLRLSNETEPEIDTTSIGALFPTEEVTSPSDPSSETLTSESTPSISAKSTSETVATPMEPTTAQTPLSSVAATPSTTTPANVEAATESDMITFHSRAAGTTPSQTRHLELSEAPPTKAANLTENGPSPLQQAGSVAQTEPSLRNRPMEASTIAYTILAALAISTLLMVVLTVAYRRRRSVLRLADELHTSCPNRARTQSPHVRYARFQDEHNMSGDNVSTISDVLTI